MVHHSLHRSSVNALASTHPLDHPAHLHVHELPLSSLAKDPREAKLAPWDLSQAEQPMVPLILFVREVCEGVPITTAHHNSIANHLGRPPSGDRPPEAIRDDRRGAQVRLGARWWIGQMEDKDATVLAVFVPQCHGALQPFRRAVEDARGHCLVRSLVVASRCTAIDPYCVGSDAWVTRVEHRADESFTCRATEFRRAHQLVLRYKATSCPAPMSHLTSFAAVMRADTSGASAEDTAPQFPRTACRAKSQTHHLYLQPTTLGPDCGEFGCLSLTHQSLAKHRRCQRLLPTTPRLRDGLYQFREARGVLLLVHQLDRNRSAAHQFVRVCRRDKEHSRIGTKHGDFLMLRGSRDVPFVNVVVPRARCQ
mmetsp:Transcript_19132/g.47817  ORF Transcript_19132/g.47817 Transcript_19132/m.47817 type:complete len:366 (-) Transcript_19132:1081-2178(-)